MGWVAGLVVASVCSLVAPGQPQDIPGLGMWKWVHPSADSQSGRCPILTFCRNYGVSHVDQHVEIRERAVVGSADLKTVVRAAARQGVTMNALRGSPEMFSEARRQKTLSEVQAILDFNHALPASERLSGIKFDVEPYLLPAWSRSEASRDQTAREYLGTLQAIRVLLDQDGSGLELAVDVPHWWDSQEYKVMFDGRKQALVFHVLDLTDWITVMSYSTSAGAVLAQIADELEYARQSGRYQAVSPAMDVSSPEGRQDAISFHNLPISHFGQALKQIRESLRPNPYVRYIMLHCHECLDRYMRNR